MPTIAPNYTFFARVTKIIDGDTLDILLSLGFHLTATLRLRLARVDTPEMSDQDPEVRLKARAAKDFVAGAVLGHEVVVRTQKSDSFGRYLAEVWYGLEQTNLNDALLAQGHAVLYVRGSA